MKNFVKHIVFITITVFLFIECNAPTKPITPVEKVPYMTLNIGDQRQYYDQNINLYTEWNVIDTARRTDGSKIFLAEYFMYLPNGRYEGKFSHFIRDGYFWQTDTDTVKEPGINEENPFLETKIIPIFPNGDEYFISTIGVPDSEKVYRKIRVIDSLETPLATYKDVLECEVIGKDTSRVVKVYYVKEYGHIGLEITNQNGTTQSFATYIKVGDKEIGEYIPLKAKKINGLVDEAIFIDYNFFNNQFYFFSRNKRN